LLPRVDGPPPALRINPYPRNAAVNRRNRNPISRRLHRYGRKGSAAFELCRGVYSSGSLPAACPATVDSKPSRGGVLGPSPSLSSVLSLFFNRGSARHTPPQSDAQTGAGGRCNRR